MHFGAYVQLAASLGLPFAVITDWDPLNGTKPPLGRVRTMDIWDAYVTINRQPKLTAEQRAHWNATDFVTFSTAWAAAGIFLNEQTFETSIVREPILRSTLLDILDEQGFGSIRTTRIAVWRSGEPVDPGQLLAMIADIGKGRLSAKLAKKLPDSLIPPPYIASAIQFVADRV